MEKRELLRPVVFVGNTVANCAKFMLQQMQGGGWVDLGRTTEAPPTPAKITILNNPNRHLEDPRESEANL